MAILQHAMAGRKLSSSLCQSLQCALRRFDIGLTNIEMIYMYSPLFLVGRSVTFYPRTDPTLSTYLFFEDYADLVRRNYDINVSVDAVLEDHATNDQKERCIDILDFILESLNK